MWLFETLLEGPVLEPLIRPLARSCLGSAATWLVRVCLPRLARGAALDDELRADVGRWLGASLLLLAATRNLEQQLFGLVELVLNGEVRYATLYCRMLLAIGVIQAMPDQELFPIVHPCRLRLNLAALLAPEACCGELRLLLWSLLCQHLYRSSPCLAILAIVAPGAVGWICYTLAVVQYLTMALMTPRQAALAALLLAAQRLSRQADAESTQAAAQ
jgi:hypothetical protein